MGLFSKLLGGGASAKKPVIDENLMLSQYAAHYVYEGSEEHKKIYLEKLGKMGFSEEEAEKLLEFECGILKRFRKSYLLEKRYTKMWYFGLAQPFFTGYPKEKDDILKEHFLTLSEVCKIIDEAEWHFWNSHEKVMPDGVWGEIAGWRLNGPGGDFAIKYFIQTASELGIPEERIAAYSQNEGGHLNKYKWGPPAGGMEAA